MYFYIICLQSTSSSTTVGRVSSNVLKIKKSLLELFKYCVFFDFQIMHFHWLHGITNSKGRIKTIFRLIIFISCLLICKLKSIKIIWTIHNLSSHEKKNDILSILNLAKKENLTVVCTKKEYIKVPEEFKNKITPVNLNLKIEKKNKFEQRVLECLRAN